MSKQTYDERLKEVSGATIEAKLYGCGFLMLLPDGTYKHVPVERIQIKPEESSSDPTSGDQP